MLEKVKKWWNSRKKVDPYDAEEAKLHELLSRLTAGTVEYAAAQAQLKEVNAMRKDHYESKRRFMTISDRGALIRKLAGGGITLGGVILMSKYEMDGNTWTGEKRKIADGFASVISKFFQSKD